jgi:enolase
LPLPLINIINGGKHANNDLDIQEFMISPIGASSFTQGLQWSCEIFHTLKDILSKKGFSVAVGDEGGFAPGLRTDEEALELLSLAIQKAGFKIGKEIGLALDVAAGELYNSSTQIYFLNNKKLTSDLLLEHYKKLVSNFNIFSIEDPFFEDDYQAFAKITQELGKTIQIVGDDLFVTQCEYIEHGIKNNLATALLVKMNQVGTISETFEAINLARSAGWKIIVSHRSGETEETFLADLAVLSKADQIKAGSMSRSERLAKYNRLLRIEEFKGLKNG